MAIGWRWRRGCRGCIATYAAPDGVLGKIEAPDGVVGRIETLDGGVGIEAIVSRGSHSRDNAIR